jgi:hypothetical protein
MTSSREYTGQSGSCADTTNVWFPAFSRNSATVGLIAGSSAASCLTCANTANMISKIFCSMSSSQRGGSAW